MLSAASPSDLAEDFTATLRPEARLLLCCARLDLQPGDRERIIQLLETGLDWTYLLGLASQHSLRPLLYRHLNAIEAAAVPKAAFARLWGWYERTGRHNRAIAKELLNILELLDSNGIPALPYKGPALAASIYGELALREFSDLDILLRPRDVLAAKALLQAQGYQPKYALTPAVETAFLRSTGQYHLVLVDAQSAVMVELHWMTDPDYPVEPSADEAWWSRLGKAKLGENKVRCFAPRELLLILCLHGTKHYWTSLGWLVDVAEMIRQHPRMDWDWIMSTAQKLSCERRLALSLHLAQRLLDAPLPEEIRRKIADLPKTRKLAAEMAEALFSPDHHEPNSFERLCLNLKLYERMPQRIRHCVNSVLAPSLVEWSRWPLPRALFFLYLPLRLIRLTIKYSAMVFLRH